MTKEFIEKYRKNGDLPKVNSDGDLLVGYDQLIELLESYHAEQLRIGDVSQQREANSQAWLSIL